MRRSTLTALSGVAFVLVYLGVLAVNGPFNRDAVFPFARWELFSRVPPSQQTSYGVRFVEINGEVLGKPLYYEEAGSYVSNPSSPTVWALLQDFGKATVLDRTLQAELHRKTLETRFMQDLDSARYELVERRFDVLERRRCHCFISEKVIGRFEKGQP